MFRIRNSEKQKNANPSSKEIEYDTNIDTMDAESNLKKDVDKTHADMTGTTKTSKVDKLFFSAVKEEVWLNYMADKGFALIGRVFSGYIFTVDNTASRYHYSLNLLPSSAESDISKKIISEREKEGSCPICTFSNKVYYKTLKTNCMNSVKCDAVNNYKHLKRAFAFHFGLFCFSLVMLCYQLSYWVLFDSAGILADKSSQIWKLAIDISGLFGDFPTTPYIFFSILFLILCIPFTVYYFDQFMYSRNYVKRIKEWQKK